jgi:Big-like domain-containing protein
MEMKIIMPIISPHRAQSTLRVGETRFLGKTGFLAFTISPHRTRSTLSLFLCVLCALCGSTVWAQESELTLSVHRNIGYNSGGAQIQGSFRMEATGPDNLTSVTFKVNETVVGTVTQAPFRIDFNTDDYGYGWHDLSATALTADGRTLQSETRRFEFVSEEESWKAAGRIIRPMLGLLGLLVAAGLMMALVPTLTGKRSNLPLGAPRNYGLLGGGICPNCQRPFALHWWGLNASLIGKFDRCDHCGKWGFVRRASPEQLRAAEVAELQQAQPDAPLPEPSPAEKLKRQLDDSRFDQN